MKRPVRLLMPIVIAVVLGPLIGGLLFCVAAAIFDLLDSGLSGPLLDTLRYCAAVMAVAYATGGPVAFVAGLLVSIWMVWRPAGLFAAIAAAALSVMLFRVASALSLGGLLTGWVEANFILMLTASVIAAGVCWLLTRRFARTA